MLTAAGSRHLTNGLITEIMTKVKRDLEADPKLMQSAKQLRPEVDRVKGVFGGVTHAAKFGERVLLGRISTFVSEGPVRSACYYVNGRLLAVAARLDRTCDCSSSKGDAEVREYVRDTLKRLEWNVDSWTFDVDSRVLGQIPLNKSLVGPINLRIWRRLLLRLREKYRQSALGIGTPVTLLPFGGDISPLYLLRLRKEHPDLDIRAVMKFINKVRLGEIFQGWAAAHSTCDDENWPFVATEARSVLSSLGFLERERSLGAKECEERFTGSKRRILGIGKVELGSLSAEMTGLERPLLGFNVPVTTKTTDRLGEIVVSTSKLLCNFVALPSGDLELNSVNIIQHSTH